jgi:hypothetical protein
MKFYMFRTVHVFIIRSLFILHSAMLHAIQICRKLSSRNRIKHPGPARKLSTNMYDIFLVANVRRGLNIVCMLLGISPAYSTPSPWRWDRGFRNVGKSQSDAGEIPKRIHTMYDIYQCRVYSERTPDDEQTNCPKHVEFHDKINLWN